MALRRAGHGGFVELLDDYAAAAETVARADLDYVGRRVAREDLVESVVVGTVLGEAMFGALRRLAQADASARAYDGDGGRGGLIGPGDGSDAGDASGKGDASGAGGGSGKGGAGGKSGAGGGSAEGAEVPGVGG